MRRAIQVASWGGLSIFLLSVLSYVRPEWIGLLLCGLGQYALWTGTVVAVGLGALEWRRSTRLWIIPSLICAAFAFASSLIAAPIGRSITDWEFSRHLQEYQSIVDAVRSGSLTCPVDCRKALIPIDANKKLPARIVRVMVGQCDDAFVAVFLMRTDVPTLHEGYVFRGYVDRASCLSNSMRIEAVWPYVRQITGDWYRFADRPGF